ncbi:MAG: NAD(P)/FAD-dependent oxidoreductase [Actinomycetota bacterium]
MTSLDAVVIGSGPNGLAAAVTLALAGRSVTVYEGSEHLGGGLCSTSLAEEGYLHDLCASVHPLGVASPFFRSLTDQGHLSEDLWRYAEVEFAQPLDGGDAAVARADLEETVAAFSPTGAARYRRLVAPVTADLDRLLPEILRPVVGRPAAVAPLVGLGLRAPWPFTWLARAMGDEKVAALLSGCAAHSIMALNRPATSAFATLFAATAHGRRWPLVAGGSGRLAADLARIVTDNGGRIELGHRVSSLAALPEHRVALFDTNPAQITEIAGPALPESDRRRFGAFKHGPGVFKIDYTLDEPVPWTNPDCRQALTLHVGGPAGEVVASETAMASGRHAERPFVLAVQPTVVDPTRAPEGKHVFWAYCHVPAYSAVDMTDAIEDQIERFAPGFRDVVRTRTTSDCADLEARNPNLVGGDIGGGSLAGAQLVLRPSPTLRPYETGNPALLLCSASSPPGAGVHGMAGHQAARRALATVLV